jgi:antitoxin component YwqK of YwqJK toxin-antitoxin module
MDEKIIMGIFDWLFGKKKEWEREKKVKEWKKKEEDRINRGQYGLKSNRNIKKKKGPTYSDWENSYVTLPSENRYKKNIEKIEKIPGLETDPKPLNGFGKYTFINEGTYEGNWKNRLKDGKGKETDRFGNVINDGIWENGVFTNGTSFEFYENGKLMSEIKILNKLKHGVIKKYKENGEIHCELNYSHDELNEKDLEKNELWEKYLNKQIRLLKLKISKKKRLDKKKDEIKEKVDNRESTFDKQYYNLEETLLGKNSSYIDEYGFIKLLREKLKSGEVYLEDMSSYIKDNHKKYDGGEIMTKKELYNQLEHIFTVYLEGWEKNKDTKFTGFQDIEQYHSLSQKIVSELGDLLQEKIMELGN